MFSLKLSSSNMINITSCRAVLGANQSLDISLVVLIRNLFQDQLCLVLI